ncbi:hypothetical protein AB1K54_05400 [Microbacterium sp. BWT-B31]|uniref:hypothetical protein n=1 Tax=Microbacterium sp. BWT-B31 TaxID=3232072 RepID=UPI0035297B12
MSSVEPFMPAHEPPAPRPDTERDIDGDVDVILEPEDPAQAGAAAFDPDAPPPPFHPPVPGEHLTRDELEHDLDDEA